MKSSEQKKLKEYTLDTSDALKGYCLLISKLYGLEDSDNNGSQSVVYGECPSIPSAYVGSPKNINIDFALDVDTTATASSKQHEVPAPASTTERGNE